MLALLIESIVSKRFSLLLVRLHFEMDFILNTVVSTL